MKLGVFPIDDPHSMKELYLATLPSRVFESKVMWVMPDAALVLGGDFTPGWKEIHQIVQLQAIGLSPSKAHYTWHLFYGRR